MTRSSYLRAIVVVVLTLWLPFGVDAQIRTDSSLGRPAQTLTGPRYQIPQTLGRLAGSNLFYSFQTFNINTGESANFTTVTPNISNVVCRVTGGTASLINGVLSLTAASGTPSFFFINPSGVTFGAGASIDVPGAFHVSTADYVKFADGNFYADATKASTFSSAPPEAFGFLGTNRGAITIKDGATISAGPLQPLSLTASDIEINNVTVSTQGGDIRVLALGQRNQEIGLTGELGPADGDLHILNGARILSQAIDAHDGGTVRVGAGSITIDAKNSTTQTGIVSQAGSSRHAGALTVTATNNLMLVNGGQIASNTHSSGDAGTVTVSSGDITIDSQGSTHFVSGIFSSTSGTGNGGEINVTATGNLSAPFVGYIAASTASTGNAGSVSVSVGGSLSLLNGSLFTSSTNSSGNAGNVTVMAGNITVDSQSYFFGNTGIESEAGRGSSGKAGNVNVTAAGDISLFRKGEISTSTFSSGDAGTVTVSAGSITLDGRGQSLGWGILSDANGLSDTGANGKAGSVHVTTTGNLSVLKGDYISSSSNGGLGAGNAGAVTVNAGSITIDNQGYFGGTGIFSTAGGGGNGGDISVVSSGNLSVLNGGSISSSSYGPYSTANAGAVKVTAGDIVLDGQGFRNFATGISSDTNNPYSGANAGSVSVTASGNLSVLNGASISSSTVSSGNAGSVKVNAGSIVLDGNGSNDFDTGILTNTSHGFGNAGSINVAVSGNLSLLNGAQISSSSWNSFGNAGTVDVSATTILVDGQSDAGILSNIRATALGNPVTFGRAGSVTVTASDSITLSNGAVITILTGEFASAPSGIAPTLLTVSAPDIDVISGGMISASSFGNVTAGDVLVRFDNRLTLNGGAITTSASNSNGGSISIHGRGVFVLDNSQVTTSVTGLKGNGGDINISANALVMNTGFIQANTAARNATGGNVNINVQSLVPSGSTLFVGGQQPFTFQPGVFGFNVIQAAAPTGVSGTVQITTPVLDVSGALGGLNARVIETGGLGRNPCRIEGGSSLAQAGRGGFVPSGRDLLGPPPMAPGKVTSRPPSDSTRCALLNRSVTRG